MRKAFVRLFLACVMLFTSFGFPNAAAASQRAATLPLDLRGHWSAPYAITLLEEGIITGYPDGRYHPGDSLTREEAAALLVRLFSDQGLPTVRQGTAPYTDVAGRWSQSAVQTLWAAGILDNATQFRPTAAISRGDIARYVAYLLALSDEATDPGEDVPPETPEDQQPTEEEPLPEEEQHPEEEQPDDGLHTLEEIRALLQQGMPVAFSDVPAGEVAACVQYLYERGIVTGDNTGLYRPGSGLTRGEAAALLFRVSGLPLTQTTFPPLPTQNVISVPYISQVYPVYAPVGCEPTSLLMGLKAKGYAGNVTLTQFLDAMPKTTSNPAKGFVGSPYRADPTKKTRTTIYPAKLAEYGRQYGNVIDLTGATTQQIQTEVLSGNPVVAYVTLYWEKPYYRYYNIEGQTQRLLSNNHAVLVCGYNAQNHTYYIADPYNVSRPQQPYFYWVSGYLFDELYNVRRHALAVA